MLVSDLVNQYNNSLNSGSKIATRTKGVEQLSKTVASLEKGQIFEGTVNAVKGDKVTLALSSGQTITARLDKSVSLSEGQSVFFQVKSNEGGTVQIRPVSSEFGGNPTLLNALKGAGLPENETNLRIVNSMMKEQMPVDKDSVRNMLNLVRNNPGTNIDTIVSLKKLDLPIDKAMITQYENYKESEGAILKMVDDLADDIPKALSAETVTKADMVTFQKELLATVSGEKEAAFANTFESKIEALTSAKLQDGMINTISEDVKDIPKTQINQNSGQVAENVSDIATQDKSFVNAKGEITYPKDSLGGMLGTESRNELSRALNELPNFRMQNPELFDSEGRLRLEDKSSSVLKAVNNYFNNNEGTTKEQFLRFLDSPPVKELLNKLMQNSWTMEPKDLLKKDSVNKLYEKIEEDMQKIIESSTKATKSESNPIALASQSVKDNLSFIREVNQIYQYVQIPLKMSGENTTGELYVYSNKKQKRAENDEITAFLHFDMEHLGSTDISVKLAGKSLKTHFYLEDDVAFDLISENIHILDERLTELGYDCDITAENDSKEINFVEDFLKQDVKSAGDIRRYSFDVRA